VPGVLKNAIDIASELWGANSFAGKPGAVIGISIGAPGSAMTQQHLRSSLAYLDVQLLAQPEAFVHFTNNSIAPDGTIGTEKSGGK
jgi:chromate reductase